MQENILKTATVITGWQDVYDEFWAHFGPCFRRADTRRHAERYIRALLGRIERKNGWQMAEYLGDRYPYAIQHFLGRASWDAEKVRDHLIRYVPRHILSPDEGGVLIIDETGFLKKGTHSVGVQRQYSGTTGRIENCQIGVFMTLAGSKGHTLIDCDLYLSQKWCEDPARRAETYIPDDVSFRTKPQLAQKMIERAYSQGLHPEWIVGDPIYGSRSFRNFLESQHQHYVIETTSQQRSWIDLEHIHIDSIIEDIPGKAWQRYSVGSGTEGEQTYDWISCAVNEKDAAGNRRYILARRSISAPYAYAFHLCYAPEGTSTQILAEIAGKRWKSGCCFETAKQETGLDEYEIRSWHGWYRHMTLSMVALSFLSAVRSSCLENLPEKKGPVDLADRARDQAPLG